MKRLSKDATNATLTILLWIFCALIIGAGIWNSTAKAAPIDPGLNPTTTITCTLPTEREDNSAFNFDTEGEGVAWYWGTSSGVYDNTVVTPGCQWDAVNIDFPTGLIYFVATVRDRDGRESVYSIEKQIEIGGIISSPKPPTNILIELPGSAAIGGN